ncbi:hypothetical protein D9613_001461 [Agrocybe pediades]|uniref:Protein kinase domain-containing protein n=1 Tax=Agrocybe pediades TaxID=84607 RepID=A0A8H4R540_9AGAR|nr:hypothetical protein D9613_001461 [Agrocybe pediades]
MPEEEVVQACLGCLRERGILRIFNAGTEQEESFCEGFVDLHKPGKTTEDKLFSIWTVLRRIEIASDVGGSTNRIDACFLPVEFRVPQPGQTKAIGQGDQLNTADIPVACTWKPSKSPASRQQNNLEVVSANVQIMNTDVRRMFSFGMTIEADELRLWYFGRSHSAISEIVNFEPAWLVKAFTAFMFATKEEMGYDPNITRHDAHTFTYRIPVAGGARFFRTKKVISEYRSNNVTGRMARVWLVDEVESSTKKAIVKEYDRVLKDVWLEDSARTEKQIQNAIFEDIEKFWSSPTPSSEPILQPIKDRHAHLVNKDTGYQYRKYFMDIDVDYVGEKTKPLAASGKECRGLLIEPGPSENHSGTPPMSGTKPAGSRRTGTDSRDPCGPDRSFPTGAPPVQPLKRTYSLKKQYRVVFKEECVPFGELKTLGEVVNVLRQTLVALQLLFCAGWVHRDLSCGNLLAYQGQGSTWQAKLSDLEYAKKFPPDEGVERSGDPKTGTPYFMALEILRPVYLASTLSVLPNSDKPVEEHTRDDVRAIYLRNKHKETEAKSPMDGPVVYNYQHDLESVWWLLLWTLVDRIPHWASCVYSQGIFQNSMVPSLKRYQAFTAPIEHDLRMNLKPSVSDFAAHMEQMRELLFNACILREQKNRLDDRNSYVAIHENMYELFRLIHEDNTTWADEPLGSRRSYEQMQLNQNAGGEAGEGSSALDRGKRPGSTIPSSSASKRQRTS